MTDLSIQFQDEITRKRVGLLYNYLDKIMRTTDSQYGYIIQVNPISETRFDFEKIIEMYYSNDTQINIPLDADFNFMEDVGSTLEFWNYQIMQTKKPLIMNDCELASNLFTINNNYLLDKSSWFLIPISYFYETVAILGLIGSPISFNPYYYEMLQPFMILCSQLLSDHIV